MNVPILSVGIACIIAAIVGGGMKALGTELPTIESPRRQVALGLFGGMLIGFAFVVGRDASSSSSKPVASSNSNPILSPGPSTSSPTDSPAATAKPEASSSPSKEGVPALKPRPANAFAEETPTSPVLIKNEAQLSSIPAKPQTQPKTNATTWVDPESGMMWPKTVHHVATTQAEADLYCRESTLGSYTDWRLPTKDEMSDLVSRRYKAPSVQIDFKDYVVWIRKQPLSQGDHTLLDRFNIHDGVTVLEGRDAEIGRPESYVICTRTSH